MAFVDDLKKIKPVDKEAEKKERIRKLHNQLDIEIEEFIKFAKAMCENEVKMGHHGLFGGYRTDVMFEATEPWNNDLGVGGDELSIKIAKKACREKIQYVKPIIYSRLNSKEMGFRSVHMSVKDTGVGHKGFTSTYTLTLWCTIRF